MLATGAPVLADALAAFDCIVEEAIERHSHVVVLGAVVSLREGMDEPALAYTRGNYTPAASKTKPRAMTWKNEPVTRPLREPAGEAAAP